ncbi:MAG: hypothetical protein CAPSK01_000433 [Candidatus Accumulibacter vicinus]|uniref:Transmembrane protein n=1 Tax=Candidatus Accumulibacter vicinus TaxID=2954382 RepID=A0A084Y5P0_9PROT|nr:MAG: hypothetical protein CAPSK01_000433 [Candidatus Accumulibacter vicinus]
MKIKRIYFLVPNVKVAETIVDELLLARVEERHMHILAKRDTELHALPEASMLQKSDFVPAVQRGLALGGVVGVLAGLVGLALTPGAAVIAGGILLGSSLAGAGVGAWLSGMVGLSVGNTRHKQFENAIERGELLMLIDVPISRVEEISELIQKHHPEAELEGTEPNIPAFP